MAEESEERAEPSLAYRSPDELQEVLRGLGQRLHYLNRVAIGESGFAWHLAEAIVAVGRLVPLLDDAETRRAFGDGWTKGAVPREAQVDHLLALLRRELS
ncbi:hypothetical protein [Wenxinia marina]|uniref:Uncharacterized protein n=1 Tax=Wenxinia marina DSM 24838 TaxID=1123501 RepID=A0A0D0PGN2_9RHOB|nr:hypothetical protein [Wenxinia marina]KIQ70506.1 hypothetical protein Wenmar_00882 [Wenxinia marina DSM 24838]GGL52579.1 hypothetical protein GCM10011392_03690 [Wenxinia marina]